MTIAESLLPEFDQEMGNTRKVLERVPDDRFGWKPHDKSGTLGWLASHIANMPEWAAVTMTQDELDYARRRCGAATGPTSSSTCALAQ